MLLCIYEIGGFMNDMLVYADGTAETDMCAMMQRHATAVIVVKTDEWHYLRQ